MPKKAGFPTGFENIGGDVPLPLPIAGFPTGVENMGVLCHPIGEGLQNLMEGLNSIHEGSFF